MARACCCQAVWTAFAVEAFSHPLWPAVSLHVGTCQLLHGHLSAPNADL